MSKPEHETSPVAWAIKTAKQWYCESCNTLLSDMSLEYCSQCKAYRYTYPVKKDGPSVTFFDPALREYLEREKKKTLK
jgi:hypothetical protein